MTKTMYPFADTPILSVSQWSTFARNWLRDGVIGNYLNELNVYADSTGMRVKVESGAAHIKGHYYESDNEENLVISTSHVSLTRWDLVVAEVNWAVENNKMSVKVVTGTAGANPSLPVLTQNASVWQIPIAKVVVEAGVTTISSTNVSDLRIYTKKFRQLWVAGWKPTLTNGCIDSAQTEMTTNKNMVDYTGFVDGVTKYAYVNVPMPEDYTGGNVYYKAYWQHPAATSYVVRWQLSGVAVGDNETMDVATGTAVAVDDTGGTVGNLYISDLSGAVTIAGSPATGELVQFRVSRAGAHANDTLNVTACLIGIMIWYPEG